MDEIVKRLNENRKIEREKSILESAGYKIKESAKEPKVYTIVKTRNGKDTETTGTLEELLRKFSYTLETGYSYQGEKGNKKIDTSPKTAKSLVTNLNKAVSNSAANSYSGVSYTLKESRYFSEEELAPCYAVINEKVQYAGAPCFSYEEARELAAQDETRHIFKLELDESEYEDD